MTAKQRGGGGGNRIGRGWKKGRNEGMGIVADKRGWKEKRKDGGEE